MQSVGPRVCSIASMQTLVVLSTGVMPMLQMPVTMNGVVHVMVGAIPAIIGVDYGRAVDDPPGNRSGVHPHIDVDRLGRRRRGHEREGDPNESEDECLTVHG